MVLQLMPFAWASSSYIPTWAISGSVKVTHGIIRSLSLALPRPKGEKRAFLRTIRAAASAAWVNFQFMQMSPAAKILGLLVSKLSLTKTPFLRSYATPTASRLRLSTLGCLPAPAKISSTVTDSCWPLHSK